MPGRRSPQMPAAEQALRWDGQAQRVGAAACRQNDAEADGPNHNHPAATCTLHPPGDVIAGGAKQGSECGAEDAGGIGVEQGGGDGGSQQVKRPVAAVARLAPPCAFGGIAIEVIGGQFRHVPQLQVTQVTGKGGQVKGGRGQQRAESQGAVHMGAAAGFLTLSTPQICSATHLPYCRG